MDPALQEDHLRHRLLPRLRPDRALRRRVGAYLGKGYLTVATAWTVSGSPGATTPPPDKAPAVWRP
jgi:hypothetical protein